MHNFLMLHHCSVVRLHNRIMWEFSVASLSIYQFLCWGSATIQQFECYYVSCNIISSP
uniref:Uncharacterized protein n=1 Tax=Arundo donax TaxID=35708 RepID=A0A0A9CLY1_ARUDO